MRVILNKIFAPNIKKEEDGIRKKVLFTSSNKEIFV